jgi:ATPase family associated with various cellular activities (AAA)
MKSLVQRKDAMDVMDTNNWAEANARYLMVALSWLRLRLERLARRIHPPATPTHTEPEPPQRHSFWHLSEPAPSTSAPKWQSATIDEQLEQYAREMSGAEAREEKPALVLMSKRLGLSTFERNVLLLCVGMELDTRIAGLCARAQDDPNKPYPTFALALVLFEDPSWDIVSPERPLRYWRLLEINQPNGQSLITSPLRADERAVSYVKGLEYLDDRLASLVVPLEIDGEHEKLPHSQEELVETIVHAWLRTQSTLPLIQLVGPDTLSKQLVAYHATAKRHRHIYRMPLEMVPQQPADVETLARLWHRESLLMPITLYLDAQEGDGTSGEGQAHALSRFLARSDGYFFLGTRETEARVGRTYITVDVTKPTPAEQQEAWEEALGNEAPDSPALLAGQFNLNLTTIHRIAADALEDTENERRALPDRLWNECLRSTRPRLDMLAQRLELKATWDDLVLPDEETKILHQIADQVGQRSKVYEKWGFASKMNRGLGINALFAGESGTGKTMAAEVIANSLRLSLYRIDLSAVVSKYIGETEKNLRRLFDAAEDGGAILFFDEADALFGKRSEVKDSHDRYANIEINYLLQRIEAYRGLAILATNMKSALDTAFMRRLRFIVTFPFPGPNERKLMWQKVFPPETPKDNLDYARLARLNLTGGSIHNVALNAAFMAAHAGTPVTMQLILNAARAEFRKLERPVNEADLKWPVAIAQGAKA